MKQSKIFTKTRKEAPTDEVSKNAKLLIRAGYINKEMAGVYSFLPLGNIVLNNIVSVIREEMNKIGGQELSLTALQDKSVWEKTDRWNDAVVDNWFKTKLKSGTEVGLGFTHEEPITLLMKDHIQSFRDLPIYPYQFQTKFRNEERAKSGIIRCREFLMKDLYSFSKNVEEHDSFYESVKNSYLRIFDKVGLGEKTYLTFASGGSFSKYSHEFQTVCEAGEDIIHLCEKCGMAVNDEIIKEQPTCPNCDKSEFVQHKAVEVGNIFSQGTRFTEPIGLTYKNEKGENQPVIMGAYGIGPSRIMGTVVELWSDDKGIVWPESIAPFKIHLIGLNLDNEKVSSELERISSVLERNNISVLVDDRELRAGEKFADSDLIGIPNRVTVSEKTIEAGKFEVKNRRTGETKMLREQEFLDVFRTK